MRDTIGSLFTGAAYIVFTTAGLWGFFLCLGIISDVTGYWGIVAAIFLGPVTFIAAPLYAGFSMGDWFPFILNYGAGISAAVLGGIGSTIRGK